MTPLSQAQCPTFSFVAGTIPAAMYYVQVSWVSAIGKGRPPSYATTYETPADGLAVVDSGKSTGGGHGVQRVHGTITRHDHATKFGGGCGGSQLYASKFWAGDRRTARQRASGGCLHGGRSHAEARVSDGDEREAWRCKPWWDS